MQQYVHKTNPTDKYHFSTVDVDIGQSHRETRVFEKHAPKLIELGLCPVADRPGTAAGNRGWTTVSCEQMTKRLSWPQFADRGVAVRFDRGLVGLDIDTDDPATKRAIKAVIHAHGITCHSGVAKRGSKGATVFLHDPTGAIEPASWQGLDGRPIFEILAGAKRKTTLPPTIHAKTGKPYTWLTQRTLFNLDSVEDLPTITPELVADLRAAIKPWLKPDRPKARPRIAVPVRDGGLSFSERRRLEEYARATVRGCADDLAHMTGQRRIQAFQTGCRVGRFVHHGLIKLAEIETAVASAWSACGAAKKHGANEFRRHLQSGIAKAVHDPLELPSSIGGAA